MTAGGGSFLGEGLYSDFAAFFQIPVFRVLQLNHNAGSFWRADCDIAVAFSLGALVVAFSEREFSFIFFGTAVSRMLMEFQR